MKGMVHTGCNHDHEGHDHDHDDAVKKKSRPLVVGAPKAAFNIAKEGQGEILKHIVREGSGEVHSDLPAGSKALFDFVVYNPDGEVVDDTKDEGFIPLEFRMGKAFCVKAFDLAIPTMKIGEVARFFCDEKNSEGYCQLSVVLRREAKKRKSGNEGQNFHSCCNGGMGVDTDLYDLYGKPLCFEIELKSIERFGEFKRENWEVSMEEKRRLVPQHKADADRMVKEGEFKEASELYFTALTYMEEFRNATMKDADTDAQKKVEMDMIPFQSNYTLCLLKMKDYDAVIRNATLILEKDPDNVKALFRRGQAEASRGRELEKAIEDLDLALKLDCSIEKEVRKWKDLADSKLKKAYNVQKDMCGKMFSSAP
eukprot:Nk52_evm61s1444 gene=Nk52_evmTU61s1444